MMTVKEDVNEVEFCCDGCENWGITIASMSPLDEADFPEYKRQAHLAFLNEGALVRNDEVLCPVCRLP